MSVENLILFVPENNILSQLLQTFATVLALDVKILVSYARQCLSDAAQKFLAAVVLLSYATGSCCCSDSPVVSFNYGL